MARPRKPPWRKETWRQGQGRGGGHHRGRGGQGLPRELPTAYLSRPCARPPPSHVPSLGRAVPSPGAAARTTSWRRKGAGSRLAASAVGGGGGPRRRFPQELNFLTIVTLRGDGRLHPPRPVRSVDPVPSRSITSAIGPRPAVESARLLLVLLFRIRRLLSSCEDAAAGAVPSRPVPSRPVPSRPVLSRPVPSRPVPSRPVPSRPVPSRYVPTAIGPWPAVESARLLLVLHLRIRRLLASCEDAVFFALISSRSWVRCPVPSLILIGRASARDSSPSSPHGAG